jgi:hypothetical protein
MVCLALLVFKLVLACIRRTRENSVDPTIRDLFAARDSGDKDASYEALVTLFALAEEPVDWAYDVWDELLVNLTDSDPHKRAFAAQMLARLANSDPDGRMLHDFPAVAAVMRDERFVVARHTLQSIWRVGRAGPAQATLVADELERRFHDCAPEKNASLVRTDAIKSLRKLADTIGDEGAIKARVDALIETADDEKTRKKMQAAWRRPGS